MKRLLFLILFFAVISCSKYLPDGEYELEIYAHGDIHGRFFSKDYISGNEQPASLSKIADFIRRQRDSLKRKNILLFDLGDNIHGDNSTHYFNKVHKFEEGEKHLYSRIANHLDYDAIVVGNHDIEAGTPTLTKIIKETGIPYLAANIGSEKGEKMPFADYVILENGGIRTAVLGFITPATNEWVGSEMKQGLEFFPISKLADSLVKVVRKRYDPHLVILALHAGTGSGEDDDIENPALYLASTLQGVDIVLASHDHRRCCFKVPNGRDSVLLINSGPYGEYLSGIKVLLNIKGKKVASKEIKGELIDMKEFAPDEKYDALFEEDYLKVKDFSGEVLGISLVDLNPNEAFYGPCNYSNLLHYVQLKTTGADLSFVSPSKYKGVIKAGEISYNDILSIYPFENTLYKISMTGSQIKDYLEEAYSGWVNTVGNSSDNLLNIKQDEKSGKYTFAGPTYIFDSAGGINYTVDVTKMPGSRVTIESFTDGREFVFEKNYSVAMVSFRANGGGGLLSKATEIPTEKLETLVIEKYEQVKDLLYEFYKNGGAPLSEINSVCNWKFIPQQIVQERLAKERLLIMNSLE